MIRLASGTQVWLACRPIARHVREGPTLHSDDTPVPVLEPGNGKTKTGRLWVALRDERPWGSAIPPAVFYRYSPDRKSEQAESLLAGCRGFLHADGYSGFNALYRPHALTGEIHLREVACWAHARRKLFEVHSSTNSPAAREMLEMIGRLFSIEESLLGEPPEERRKARAEHAVPLLEQLKGHMETTLAKISRKSSLAEAIRYSLCRWEALCRHTTDGRLEISNNAAERAIRPLALGRKNSMFAGSDAGGRRAAVLYTLIETAKLNGVDPEDCPGTSSSDLACSAVRLLRRQIAGQRILQLLERDLERCARHPVRVAVRLRLGEEDLLAFVARLQALGVAFQGRKQHPFLAQLVVQLRALLQLVPHSSLFSASQSLVIQS